MADLGALLPPGGKTQTDVWATPQRVFDELHDEFEFTLDPCTDGTNAKCETFFTPDDDGLSQSWVNHTVFMNPPYSQNAAWMRKAYDESIWSTVVCLVPARTDTRWWHDYAMKGEVRFIRGRLKFGDAKHSAPFPSAVVVFRALA
jgi:phage N-6-adenine-methyltransferase